MGKDMNDTENKTKNIKCPLFIDFTRMCLVKFPTLVKFSIIQTCASEHYVDCPIYQVHDSDFYCKHFYDCANQYIENIPKILQDIFINKNMFEVLKNIWTNYCLSPENSKTCAKYQLYSKGEIPSITLMPDGKKISSFDLLLGRKIIITPPEKTI
jgi:hypothetical protein